ncbi:MAG: hypothetical protein G4V63_13030 [Candidatus Afipia apatlaquensis]|uniref:Lipoprotein n=1 Tax=Candidatus Afipia apatlaquensis TaxID=2712852 RepID=A0A7C9RG75_9BRAD|nr:hypothetical protein [Candidatus Afipia apatlaquensis]
MRKHLIFLVMCAFFTLCLIGCTSGPSPSKNNQDTQQSANTNDKGTQINKAALTVEKIKEKYTSGGLGKIANMYDYRNFILVEYLNPSNIQCFDLYNLETGDRDVMELGCNAKVFDFSSGDRIVFESDGTNQMDGQKLFPYYITYTRAKEVTGSENDFSCGMADLYKLIDEEVEFGVKENEMISDLKVTLTGLELEFAPQKGKEGEFYSGSTAIPVMKTSYDQNKNQFVIEVFSTSISPELLRKAFKEQNRYIKSVQFKEKGSNSSVIINLKDSAKYYTAESCNDEEFPYVNLIFRNSI